MKKSCLNCIDYYETPECRNSINGVVYGCFKWQPTYDWVYDQYLKYRKLAIKYRAKYQSNKNKLEE